MKTKQHERGRQTMARAILFLTAITLALACWAPTMASAKTIHVKASATGAATGSSWADAYTSLQDGLAAAIAGDEIWVAAGTYKPDQGKGITPGSRNATFSLTPDISVYGGFAGTETSLGQRDWNSFRTILSGDLAGNDGPNFANRSDNSVHVVSFIRPSSSVEDPLPTVLLDGLTITGGYASDVNGTGGGFFFKSTSPVIRNCVIKDNMAKLYGGGIGSSDRINLVLKNSIIMGNHADKGGGICSGSLTLSGCTVINNTAKASGGGLMLYGAHKIDNSILWGNSSPLGPQIQLGNFLSPTYTLSVLASDVQGGEAAIHNLSGGTVTYHNNIDVDPRLTVDGRLQADSPCIDAADPAAADPDDIDGEARPHGAAPDMGADEFVDTDGDGLPDIWELRKLGGLDAAGHGDRDGDGLSNEAEYRFATDPGVPDTDGDGYADGEEVEHGANPLEPSNFPGRIYVRAGSAGAATGASWADAYTNLQDGLAAAWPGNQIWVAAGIYRPDQGAAINPGDRNASFNLKPDVSVFGGFAGTETTLAQRDWNTNRTILSGDLLGNDGPYFTHREENSHTIVRFNGAGTGTYLPPSALLDGVTVTGASAGAGGMVLSFSSPVIRNCVITGNRNSDLSGSGGIYISYGNPRFENCIVKENTASSGRGGGVYVYEGSPVFSQCTVINNHGGYGGGLYFKSYENVSVPRIENSILWGNTADNGGSQIYLDRFFEPIRVSVFSSDIEGGETAIHNPDGSIVTYQGNIDADPLLTRDGRLKPGSPCIDAADPTTSIVTDIDGEARPFGAGFDMGADEFVDTDGDGYTDFEEAQKGTDPQNPASYPAAIHVNKNATGANTGTSWADAFGSLRDALAAASAGDVIWVAAGTYTPDQGAGITPGDRYGSFKLKPDVSIYGGFGGNETSLSQRDPNRNKTILSGDLKVDDLAGFVNYGENSYNVVSFINPTASPPYPTAVLDGFVITQGNADSTDQAYFRGAGLNLENTSPEIKNCVITRNKATYGGGVRNQGGAPRFTNCVISDNQAVYGGGLRLYLSSPTLSHCTVTNNFASDSGGGISQNDANPMIAGSIFWGNRVTTELQQIHVGSGNPTIRYSDVQGGTGGIVGLGATSTYYLNNIAVDPLLTRDNRLRAGSPCIDAADPATLIVTDIDGEARPFGAGFDMGADEFIDTEGDGLPDSWEKLHGLDPNDNGSVDVNNGASGDPDGDGYTNLREYVNSTHPLVANPQVDNDGDGFTVAQGDCDDANPAINPKASEICTDGIDNDCNGLLDSADPACAGSASTTYFFPAIKDDDAIGWANYLTVAAKDPVAMDVAIRVYDMGGTLKGTYIYSNTDPTANAPAIPPYARVAQRPCLIASGSSTTCSVPVEGSMIVETSVPAIATTNTISNFFEGFSIYEAAKPKASHSFPKTYDGPNNYQVYLLAQNIHDKPVNVTVKLYGKTATSPGHGASLTTDLPAFATLKVRPSEIASGINFDGSVVITSNLSAPEDGLGPAIPAMCRYELGKEAMSIYESTERLPLLSFPVLKDGKFGSALDYQNYLSVVNPNAFGAAVEVVLYGYDGNKRATTGQVVIPARGKQTWRPSMIQGSVTAPTDFEGSAVVLSSVAVVGQTNTIYPGTNQYNTDAFDLFESAMPASTLFFPKAFDNIVGTGHLYDNFVYIQNPDGALKYIMIEQFNNNGTLNGSRIAPLPPNATYVYRPKDLVTDGTGTFRGSVRVTETGGGKIAGAIKYDLHQGATSTTPVDAMTLYRSMGQ